MPKFNPPEVFNFSKPAEWPEWKQRFSRFRIATKLNDESDEVQICSLIYAMGNESEHIFKSLPFGQGEDKKYNSVLAKFDEYFVPKRNIIHERARFHLRNQNQGESIEAFVRSLHEIAEHCEFENKSQQLRDRLVIGINDKALSEKLQLQSDLTLEKAVEMARNKELVQTQIKDLQSKSLDAVRNVTMRQPPGNRSTGNTRFRRGNTTNASQGKPRFEQCGRCNRRHDVNGKCPAFGKQCKKCHKMNHFAAVCKSKQINEIAQERGAVGGQSAYTAGDYSDETFFLESVTTCEDESEAWYVTLKVCKKRITFKIDTGADTSIITESCYNTLPWKPKLKPVTTQLLSPGGALACIGVFDAKTFHKGKVFAFKIHVIKGGHNNLLARSVAHKMGLIMKVENVGLSVFGKTGRINTQPVKITLKENATPYCMTTARRVPFPLMPKVKAELDRMENDDIIVKVTEPTDWCAPMVPVVKKNSDIRICVDLKRLNEAVKREHFMLPNLDDIAPKLNGATVFSKLDASSGFHQLALDTESCHLTTFITPFGRYCFKRVPFGITSAPEIFQRKMSEILCGLEGTEAIIDDVLIYGRTLEEHNERLEKVIRRIHDSGLRLNKDKCEFRKDEIEYFGHIINAKGVSPSPERVKAIRELPAPTNVPELRRVLGMINYLGRFLPDLSTVLQPITELLKTDVAWTWDTPQIDAFNKVKDMITETPVLTFYDPSKPVVVSADASSYGLGAALYQIIDTELKPVAFTSRTLSTSERKYAQIEKECLAAVWACEKFERYLVGLESFKLMTDHKPLVPLINTQDLDRVPLRCQRLLMRMRRFSVRAEHVPGKQLIVPDTLSRSPLRLTGDVHTDTCDEVNMYVNSVIESKPISDRRLEAIRVATKLDGTLQQVMNSTRNGWTDREKSVPVDIKPYFASRSEYSVAEGLLLYRDRIAIPETLRSQILTDIHSGHLGLNKCRKRAPTCVWWPGISKDIERVVMSCEFCRKLRPSQKAEPLKVTLMPERPWQRVAADLCELKGSQYLVVMDYYSRYLEIAHLTTITSVEVIGKLKNIFARWGVPEVLVSDNGGQFTSDVFKQFAEEYNFSQVLTSPHYPQANGEAESGVRIAKKILQQEDIFIALMAYRSTPIPSTGVSPSELIMGRRMRTTIPVVAKVLVPKWPNLQIVRKCDEKVKETMRTNFNNHHGVQSLHPLSVGDKVRIKTDKEKYWNDSGVVRSVDYKSRSYVVETPKGNLRRNRKHLQYIGHSNVSDDREEDIVDTLLENARTSVQNQSGECKPPIAATKVDRGHCEFNTNSRDPEFETVKDVQTTRSGRAVVQPSRFRDYV